MNIVSAVVVFFCIWWLVIFCVLPIGMSKTVELHEDAGAPGSPKNPMIKKKLLMTTGITIILWIIVYFIISSGWIDFREMAEPK